MIIVHINIYNYEHSFQLLYLLLPELNERLSAPSHFCLHIYKSLNLDVEPGDKEYNTRESISPYGG